MKQVEADFRLFKKKKKKKPQQKKTNRKLLGGGESWQLVEGIAGPKTVRNLSK